MCNVNKVLNKNRGGRYEKVINHFSASINISDAT